MVRTVNRARCAVATAGLLGVIGGISVAADSARPEESWAALTTLRSNLEAQPLLAEFVQEYLPAGFTSGDRESGVIYLDLPGCVRWDYLEPYAKSFLLCGAEIYTWNPGEGAGRRFEFTDNEEPGIDLLRLRLEELEQRYGAHSESDSTGTEVVLTPLAEDAPISEARLQIDPTGERLAGLSYSDREGNHSRFTISDYRPLEDSSAFELPADLEWVD